MFPRRLFQPLFGEEAGLRNTFDLADHPRDVGVSVLFFEGDAEGVGGHVDLDAPYLLVAQHPVTTEYGQGEQQIEQTLEALKLNLAVMDDPAMHGTVAIPDRALIVSIDRRSATSATTPPSAVEISNWAVTMPATSPSTSATTSPGAGTGTGTGTGYRMSSSAQPIFPVSASLMAS